MHSDDLPKDGTGRQRKNWPSSIAAPPALQAFRQKGQGPLSPIVEARTDPDTIN